MSPTVLCAKCLKNPCPCEPAGEPDPGIHQHDPDDCELRFAGCRKCAALGVETNMPYSVRIPAAIKRAEGLIEPRVTMLNDTFHLPLPPITATELALAKALLEAYRDDSLGWATEYPHALIEFCEKVESL